MRLRAARETVTIERAASSRRSLRLGSIPRPIVPTRWRRRRGARREIETEGRGRSSPFSESRLALQLGGPAKRSGMAYPTASGLSGSGSGGQQQITRPRPVPISIAASRSRSTRTSRPSPHALVEEELLAQTHAHGRASPDESLRWKPRDEQPVLERAGLLDRCAGRCRRWS